MSRRSRFFVDLAEQRLLLPGSLERYLTLFRDPDEARLTVRWLQERLANPALGGYRDLIRDEAEVFRQGTWGSDVVPASAPLGRGDEVAPVSPQEREAQ